MLSRRHGAVATHVAVNSASAFSALVEQILPLSVMMVLTREEAFQPEAIHFAWNRLVWSTPERNCLQELSFALSMARLKTLRAAAYAL